MGMPGRRFAAGNLYRYGFNGKENDNEVEGEGNQQDYGMRIYDPRLGRFLSVDPLTIKYPELSVYQFASNSPVAGIDLDGTEILPIIYFVIRSEPVQKAIYKQQIIEAYKAHLNSGERFVFNGYKGLAIFAQTGIDVAEKGLQFFSLGESNPVTGRLLSSAKQNAIEMEQTANRGLQLDPASRPVAGSPRNNVGEETSTGDLPNRGISTTHEDVSKRNSAAQQYEDGVTGAASDVKTQKRIVPTLKYDNPNPNGKNYVKWDGIDVLKDIFRPELIDRKKDITFFQKSIDQVRRFSEALNQNPKYRGVIEVPNEKVKVRALKLLEKAGVENIIVRISP